MELELVTTWEEIKNNVNELKQYRYSTCFMVYERDGELSFAPSRFVGYANNNMSLHLSHHGKDGRKTNPVVSRILGEKPDEDDSLEREYRNFCDKINVEPKPTGPCRNKRKYWFVKQR